MYVVDLNHMKKFLSLIKLIMINHTLPDKTISIVVTMKTVSFHIMLLSFV